MQRPVILIAAMLQQLAQPHVANKEVAGNHKGECHTQNKHTVFARQHKPAVGKGEYQAVHTGRKMAHR